MSSENTHETVAVEVVMDAATAAYLNRQRTEEDSRAAAQSAYLRGRRQSPAELTAAELAETKRDLAEALDEIARLIAINSALKNHVATLEEKLASRGGSRGPSQAILDRQNRCRPRFLEAAAVDGVGTNAADLVAEGLFLKDKGWQLNDIYAVAAQAEAAGLVVKRSKGRKAFWYTPEVLARMEERVQSAQVVQAAAQAAEAAVKPEDEVVIDLT